MQFSCMGLGLSSVPSVKNDLPSFAVGNVMSPSNLVEELTCGPLSLTSLVSRNN